MGVTAPAAFGWMAEHWSLALVLVAVVLIGWRLMARRAHADLSSGIATLALVALAVAVPVVLALGWVEVSSAWFWWSTGVALTAAALASTEWLRVPLRVFAALAAVALAGVLLHLGSDHLDKVRCHEVGQLARDVEFLDEERDKQLADANTAAGKARDQLAGLVRTGGANADMTTAGQSVITALDSGDSTRLANAVAALGATYRPGPASDADTKLFAAADKSLSARRAVDDLGQLTAPTDPGDLDKEKCADETPGQVSDVDLTGARRDVAEYRSSLLPTDANKAAASKAADRADAATAAEAQGEEGRQILLVNDGERGGDRSRSIRALLAARLPGAGPVAMGSVRRAAARGLVARRAAKCVNRCGTCGREIFRDRPRRRRQGEAASGGGAAGGLCHCADQEPPRARPYPRVGVVVASYGPRRRD